MKTPTLAILFFLFAMPYIHSQSMLLLKSSGKVVIGDTTQMSTPGNYSLYVQNGMLTERVKVSLKSTSEWSDDAFQKCPTIDQVANTISENSHLYEMPSAVTLKQEGYELKSMDAKLLEQIEWLWQHVIRLDAENKTLRDEVSNLKNNQAAPKK
jgi:trimeric autotransporter adhesin